MIGCRNYCKTKVNMTLPQKRGTGEWADIDDCWQNTPSHSLPNNPLITSMRWEAWSGVSEITPCLSISQWFTSPRIFVSEKGAHHMLTTLPFSSAQTYDDSTSTQHPQVWLWLLCWASCGCGALLWCGRMGWCIIITCWPSEHTLKQMTRVGVAWLVHDYHSTHMAKVELESGWMCLNTTQTQPPSKATCVGCEPLPCPSHW